jgi:hypothetical protein
MEEEPRMKDDKMNREAWLRAAYALVRKELLPKAPAQVAISWSFPSKGGTKSSRRTIGECHYKGGSAVGVEGDRVILISPTLQEPFALIEVLVHEMVHAALPMGSGHRAPFSRLAKSIGLLKPWTATTAGPELKRTIEGWLKRLPAWPGGHLLIVSSQKNRQLKAVCECERIIRGSAKLFEAGPIMCGLCEAPFELAN